jgi:hypothetical protein
MNWFTTRDKVRTVPWHGPDDELARVELEYQAAERELDNAKEAVRQYCLRHPRPDAVQIVNDGGYLRVNTQDDSALDELCARRNRDRIRRNALLDSRAKLMVPTYR